MKKIKIKCTGAKTADYKKMLPFQEDLKGLSDENKQKLKHEIKTKGFGAPILVWENEGKIYTLDGHQRCKALAELEAEGYQIPPIPVALIHPDDLKEAKEFILGFVSQYGHVSETGLLGYIAINKLDRADILNFDFPNIDMDALLSKLQKNLDTDKPGADDAPRLPAKAKTKRGQLFTLGNHRLICGDSTDWKDMNRLMGKDQARLVFTDPPYGVSYTGAAGQPDWEEIKNDNLRADELTKFLQAAFECMARATIEKAAVYVFHASINQRQFEEALNKAGFRVKQQLIWNKGMILSRSDYHWAHEPLFYAVKQGKNCEWYGDRTGRTMISMQQIVDVEKLKKEQMQAMLTAMLSGTTNWEFKRDNVMAYQHPNQKPVSLCGMALKNNTMPDDIVLDPFGGSGSTLMACEFMQRQCRTSELDEKFCDVIIERWEKHTGKKAKLEK